MAGDIKLPDIKASVKVDSKGVDAGLDRVQASTRGAGKGFEGLQAQAWTAIDGMSSSLTSKLGPASGAAESALSKLSSTGAMMGAGVAAGAAVAGVAIGKFAMDGINQLVALDGEIRNFQRASGASAEESSRFVAVLDDLGVKSETAGSALFKLGKKVADGGGDLTKFGVDIAYAKDGTAVLTETLLNVADAYAAQPDPAKRAELAFAAFGKQGKDLIPVLEQGRVGLKAYFDGVKDGETRTQAQLDQTRKFELAMDDLSDTSREFKLEAGSMFIPYATGLALAGTKTLEFLDGLKSKAPSVFGAFQNQLAGSVGGPLAQLAGLLGNVATKGDTTKQSAEELAAATLREAEAAQEAATAQANHAAALDRITNATLGTLSSQLGYEQSVNTLKDNLNDLDDRTAEYAAAVEKSGANSKEAETANRNLRDAHLGIEQSALAAAGAAVRLAEDEAAAGGSALTAQEKSDIFKQALENLAGQADGPSRDAILNLATDITNLPKETVVGVDADTSQARAAIADLERRLAYLARYAVSVENNTNKGTAGDPDARAHGGPVIAGRPYIVGEKRPELFVPEVNGRIIPRVPATASPAAATAGGAPIDYDRLAAAIAAHPPRAYVVASDVAQGLHGIRRR